jgi:integrase
MRWTGCRPGELARLRWRDVDTESGRIVLREHKTAKKTRRPRVIHLVPVTAKLLAHRRKASEGDHVFVNSRGRPWDKNSLGLRVKRCRDRQGVPAEAKLYGIRHRFGTSAIVNGVDLKTLAELMGHVSTRMTEHYVHLAEQGEHLGLSKRRAVSRRPGA